MTLDRHALAGIDRRLLAELNGDGEVQMVKIPVSEALWSVWRHNCNTVGATMGEAVAALIGAELATVIGDDPDTGIPVFADRTVRRVVDLMERLDDRGAGTHRMRPTPGRARS